MTSPRLLLPKSIYQALVAHARAQYPNEACGLLRGRAGRVSGFLPARNIAPTPRSDYEVDPESLLQALSWEDEGDELIAIFHSHPTSPPYPSFVDAAKAFYPDSVYLILSLQQPRHPELKGFHLRSEAAFTRTQARAMRQGIPFVQVRPGLWAYRIPSEGGDEGRGEDVCLVYDREDGPMRLIHIQPVSIHILL
ncbi:MAG TPA: M67 family metallopeptidase [Caldilineae bacterium]|nr:M67 family metallopeptidase [Caldilineae bacterium]